MAITEAVENYLETILILSKAQPDVHAIDICSYLGYSRPTVSIILKKMKDEGLVNVNTDNHITLTDEGKKIAEKIVKDFVVNINDLSITKTQAIEMIEEVFK